MRLVLLLIDSIAANENVFWYTCGISDFLNLSLPSYYLPVIFLTAVFNNPKPCCWFWEYVLADLNYLKPCGLPIIAASLISNTDFVNLLDKRNDVFLKLFHSFMYVYDDCYFLWKFFRFLFTIVDRLLWGDFLS